MDYKELLKNRRSVRNYAGRKVPLETLHEIIQETCLAPSSCNRQPWRFILIQDVHLIKRLSDENKKNWLLEIEKNQSPFLEQFEPLFKNPDYNIFYNASSLVIICGVQGPYAHEDCSLAAAYFMFAATERQLGTCWIAWGEKILDPQLRVEIGITDDLEIVAPLIIGYPQSVPPLPERESIILKEIIG